MPLVLFFFLTVAQIILSGGGFLACLIFVN